MAQEILITDIIDVSSNVRDLEQVLAEIENMEQAILKVNKNPINLQGVSGMKELREAANQLTQALNQLNTTVSGLSKNNTSKLFAEQARSIDVATDATQENTIATKENLTWSQFLGQRMTQYMKIYGDHASAIRKISEEWKAYKITGENVIQTSTEIAAAQQKEIAAVSEKETLLGSLNEKCQQAAVLAKNLADQFGVESEQATNAAKTVAQLKQQIDELNAIPAAATPNISAYEQLKNETKEAEINARNLAAQFGADSKQALEAANAYTILKQKLDEVNNVTKTIKPIQATTPAPATSQPAPTVDVSAYQKLNAEVKKAELNARNLAAEFGADSKEATEAAQAYEVLRLKLESINKVTKEPRIIAAANSKDAINEQKIVDQIANEYQILSKAYQDAALKSKNYYLTLGASHPITLEAQKDARALKAVLDTVDQATGDYRRNVGNYSSAINNLRLQTGQLLRETPNLALNAQTFILSLSNNLPLFFEAIENVKKGNEDLAASGQKPIPVFKQIINSLFSLQSALTIGVTLLTIFGAKIIEGVKELFGFEDAEKKAERQTKQLTQALKEQSDAYTDFSKSVEKAVDRTIAKLKELGANENELNNARNTGLTLKRGKAEADAKANIDFLNSNLSSLKEIKKRYEAAKIDVTDIGAGAVKKDIDRFLAGPLAKIADIKLTDGDVNNYDKVKTILNTIEKLETEKNFSKLDATEKSTFAKVKQLTEAILNDVKTAKDLTDQVAQNIADQRATNVADARNATRGRLEDEITTNAEISERNKRAILDQMAYDKQVKAGNFEALRKQVLANMDFELNAERDKIGKINAIRNLELENPEISEADKIRINSQADAEIARVKLTAREKEKIRKEAASKLFDIDEQERKRNLEADKAIFVQRKQLQADLKNELSNIDDFSLENRLQFVQASITLQKAVIDKEHETLIASKQFTYLTDQEKLQIEVEYQSKLLELNRKTQQQITDIIKSALDKQQELREEDIEKLDRLYRSLNLNNNDQYTRDAIDLNNSLKSKITSYESYLIKRRDLDEQYKQQGLSSSIDQIEQNLAKPVFEEAATQLQAAESARLFFQVRLKNAKTDEDRNEAARNLSIAENEYEIAKKNFDKKVDLENKLDEYKRQLSDAELKYQLQKTKEHYDKIGQYLQQLGELASQIGDFGAALAQRRIDAIENEKDALEERYAVEQDLINQAYTNQVDRQQKLLEAQKKYNAQKHQLDEQEKIEKIKQAKFEKEANIASITLNTAANIVKAFPNVAAMITAGIVGAAQLAIAIATPLPRFFKGKNTEKAADNYEGPAMVDDGADGKGKAELIVREDGSMEVGTNKPRVTYLHKNDIVFPDAQKALEKRTDIEKFPVKTYVQYIPKALASKNDPIRVAFPQPTVYATNSTTNRFVQSTSNLVKEKESSNHYFQLVKPIEIPDPKVFALTMTASAAEAQPVFATSDNSALRSDVRMIGKNIVNAIKTQPKPKKPDMNYEIMKAWLRSNKSFDEFFK